jgi:hypothetical protein
MINSKGHFMNAKTFCLREKALAAEVSAALSTSTPAVILCVAVALVPGAGYAGIFDSWSSITGTPRTQPANKGDAIGRSGPSIGGQIVDWIGDKAANSRANDNMDQQAKDRLKSEPLGTVAAVDKEKITPNKNSLARDSKFQPSGYRTGVTGTGKNLNEAAREAEIKRSGPQIFALGERGTVSEINYYQKQNDGTVKKVDMNAIAKNQLLANARDSIAKEKEAERKRAEAARVEQERQQAAVAEAAAAHAAAQAAVAQQAAAQAAATRAAADKDRGGRERGMLEPRFSIRSNF